ncbi:hypothetical protein A3709_18985 [Halioglobus sp. HI00S01]|uniref:hypothetical protein n=1 Tax=Halioglobus sp. HI00S01 TaxID=1822214 RepID=UPI0007C20271|nr:hypothetical protein [Halioglobus sp. HI00S01]KZX57710.1 hypothetical protein A3709_18985 [Halioglobus sp. HI00S01]
MKTKYQVNDYFVLEGSVSLARSDSRANKDDLPRHEGFGESKKNTLFRIEDVVPTALPEPHPQYQYIVLDFQLSDCSRHYLVCDEQLDSAFVRYHQYAPGEVLVTKTDVTGRDNCYNQPAQVTVAAGTRLSSDNSEGTRIGTYYFRLQDGGCIDLHTGAISPHPYALPVVDPRIYEILPAGA